MDERDRDIVAQSMARRIIEVCAIEAYLEVAQGRAESFQPGDIVEMLGRMDELVEELNLQHMAIITQWGYEALEGVTEAAMAITGDIGHE